MTALRADDGFGSSVEIVQLLLNSIGSSGVDGPDTSFIYDADHEDLMDCELMSSLLEHGVLKSDCVLRYAISGHDLHLVKLALNFDAYTYCQVLEAAVISMAGLEIVQLLLEHESDPEEKGRALQAAAYLGLYEHVELLIHAGTDINAPLPWDTSGLEWAQMTALQAAAQQGHFDVIQLLLEEGAEVERSSISEGGEGTALQFAAISGSIAIANELVQRGANVNAAPMGRRGRTALEGAAEHGRLDMVQLLLNLEAEVRGSRALQFARKEGHDGVAMLLLQNGFEDDVRMSG